jgi:DNA-binding response OmpR family regulator
VRLLLVDDSNLFRTIIKDFFGDLKNIEIEEATNGFEALDKHRSFNPNIIILDVIIPPPDGLVILKILRKFDDKVKIIMVSTLGKQKYVYEESMNYGAFAVLTKPIDRVTARKTILQVVAELREGEHK